MPKLPAKSKSESVRQCSSGRRRIGKRGAVGVKEGRLLIQLFSYGFVLQHTVSQSLKRSFAFVCPVTDIEVHDDIEIQLIKKKYNNNGMMTCKQNGQRWVIFGH